jgi:hypothetical protein
MFQALELSGPQWAAEFLEGAARGTRVARAIQSAAASALLSRLRAHANMPAGPSSKAHSRAAVAAALIGSGVVGIDVEHRTPGRPIAAIVAYLMGTAPADETSAYRVFTFREAYFKAVGAWPDKTTLQAVSRACEARYVLSDGLNVLHELVCDDFVLTLVWRA